MDVREQSPTRLVLTAYAGWRIYISGVIALGLGIYFLSGGINDARHNIGYTLLIGPVGLVAGLAILLGPLKCVLTVDRAEGELNVKKGYVLGLVPITRSISLTELNQFNVQHQFRSGYSPPALKFTFKSSGRKATFYSQNLHFNGKKGFFRQLAQYDAHQSDEERLIQEVASYINLSATATERLTDSPNLTKRLLYVAAYFVGGVVIAIALIWFYYHIIHK